MIVFSGDQLNGQKTSYDALSVLAKFAQPVIERKIPWAAVFGNHDSEIADDREMQMRALASMPYSLARSGPVDVDGVGNCECVLTPPPLTADDIKIHSPDASHTHIFTLYFLDSHTYQKSLLPFLKADYDYIKPSQIEWFRQTSSRVEAIERPFQPDGASDIGEVWARRRAEERQSRTLAKPNAMMFFHIPLPEAYADADTTDSSFFKDGSSFFKDGKLSLGAMNDGEGSSKTNGGLFSNGIQKMLESSADRAVTEVKVLSHGHCHNTDRCRRVQGVWMCFDGGSSFSGYGKPDFDRRVRVYNVSGWGETITTYKRLTTGEIIDQQVLVGEGAPAGWGQIQ